VPICKKCEHPFPNRVLVDGKRRQVCRRKYCLECSPFGRNNRRQLHRPLGPGDCTCAECGRDYTYSKQHGHTKLVCNACLSNKRREGVKRRAVEYLGGECQICGYKRCLSALQFHHRDELEKEFNIGGSYNRSWKSLRAELDKCDLLCANCHCEVHGGLMV
jgi:hypothetical protein